MFVVNNYTLAVVFCFVTMLCWGSFMALKFKLVVIFV